jgi:hypothetical protein
MNKFRIVLAAVAVSLLLFSGVAAADDGAIPVLAGITLHLNHFPTDADKDTLHAIIDNDDSSDEAATIAMALLNMQHKVTAADAERLQDLIDDEASDAAAQKLATILLGINHAPSDADKTALAALGAK